MGLATSTPDGRTARGDRTRRRLAEGLIALLEEGVPEPTARQVAERAGVSLRLVFHHFDDMEHVMRAAVEVQVERHWNRLRPIDPALPLAERISRMVRQRATLFDAVAPVRRAAGRAERTSPTIAQQMALSRVMMRAGLETAFAPELEAAGRSARDLLDALDVAASWETWEQLRSRMGHPPARAKRAMTRLLTALLAGGAQ